MIKIFVQATHSQISYNSAIDKEITASETILTTKFLAEDSAMKHSVAVKRGFVSPYKLFYIPSKHILPTGFVPYLRHYYEKSDLKYEMVDLRKFPGVDKAFLRELHAGEYESNGFVPRDYQIEAVLSIINNKGGICALPTGSGKSFIAYLLTRAYAKSCVLFIFDSIDLITQTYEMFLKYGMDKSELSIIQGQNFIDDGRIILLSMMSYEQAAHLFPRVKVIIADEVHSTGRTATAEKVIYSCQNAPVHIGLSATPDRIENPYEQMRLYGNIGHIVFKREFIDQMDEGILADTEVKLHRYQCALRPISGSWADTYEKKKMIGMDQETVDQHISHGWELAGDYLRRKTADGDETTHVVKNDERNTKLIEIVAGYADAGKRVLGIFTRIDQGNRLLEMYPKAILIHGEDDIRARKEAEAALRRDEGCVVFASNIWGKGLDIEELDVYVNLSGGVSSIRVIQRLGRVVRKSGTTQKDKAIVVDLIDDCVSHIGKKQSAKRRAVYKSLGLKITEV